MNNNRHSPTLPLALRALALLAVMIGAEVVNGTVRTLVVAPMVGDFTARQIGTVTGCVLIGLIAWFGGPWLRLAAAVRQRRASPSSMKTLETQKKRGQR